MAALRDPILPPPPPPPPLLLLLALLVLLTTPGGVAEAWPLGGRSATARGNPGAGSQKSPEILAVHPRDIRQKGEFLKYLTGPLYFNPKCRKDFYRLYHNTRDCTIPAYYKRCARLLTRLASSPRCTER